MKGEIKSATGEIGLAVAMILVGAAAIALSWRMPAGTVQLPGPRVLPTVLGGVLIVLALLHIVIQIVRRRAEMERVPIGHANVWITLLALALMTFAFERIGAVAALPLLLYPLLKWIGGLGWSMALIGTAAGTGAAWLIFVRAFGVQLPRLPF